MKISHFAFGNKLFTMTAENPDEQVFLRRFLDLAPRCWLRAVAWEVAPPVPRRPHDRAINRVDLRLVDFGAYSPRDADEAAAKKAS